MSIEEYTSIFLNGVRFNMNLKQTYTRSLLGTIIFLGGNQQKRVQIVVVFFLNTILM